MNDALIRTRFPNRTPGGIQNGFTLIELVVTICILVILGALLVPTLGTAVAKGESAKCTSNLRQIGMALMCFASDHDGLFPEAGQSVARGDLDPTTQCFGWAEQLAPYVGDNWQVFVCPTTSKTIPCNREMGYFLGTRAAYVESGELSPVRLSKIHSPTRQIMGGDNLYRGFKVEDVDKDDYSIACPFAGPRPHAGKSNILFADGSVRSYSRFNPSEMQCTYDDPSEPY